MQKIKNILFVSLFFLPAFSLKAQTIKEFSSDSVKFYEEIKSFMENARKKEGKAFMEEFMGVWYGGYFTERERNDVYDITNFMLSKKMQPFPEFKSYLFSLISFFKSSQSEESFKTWTRILKKLINKGDKKDFIQYLEFSNDLFEDNALYKSASVVWKVRTSEYSFQYKDEPYIELSTPFDLICLSKGDSAVIYSTTGHYYPLRQEWTGEGGIVTWERAGFDRNDVYAELSSYKIKLRSPSYEAKDVTFHNNFYFAHPLKGRLEDKVLANVTPEKATYPRFYSYDKRIVIKDLYKNVDYDGGYTQEGAKFKGSGTKEERARLIFNWEGEPLIIAESNFFSIRETKITSERTKVYIKIDEDSIVHPGVKLNFHPQKRLLNLYRPDEGIGKTPFFNSYHQVDMYFEALYWKIDDPVMEIKPLAGSTNKKAFFESTNYYKQTRYDKLQGIDEVHPLVRIRMCIRKLGYDEFYVSELVKCMKLPPTQIRPLLFRLSFMGFLYYDYDADYVRIAPKLYHYVNARAQKEDYDVISFNSNVKGEEPNATINLLNFDMTIRGVKNVLLSDSQRVYIFPKERRVVLKKNRDFTFDGIVNAGKFEFYGSNYEFSYDNFNINMPVIDSLIIWANTDKKDDYGNTLERRVKTVIQFLKGDLQIDGPGNKSGIIPNPHLPEFRSHKDSYVFYDRPSIQKGVYDQDKFYFHLKPFTFDSLVSFDNKSVQLEGTLTSAGIFPEFEEKLRVMPDYSLGFTRPTPPGGFDMYGGKGKFFNQIELSHKGLKGDGRLTYLTSTTESKEFFFYPDSTNAMADNFIIEEQLAGVEYPPTSAKDVYIHWEPYNDILTAKTIDVPFALYDGTKLTGELYLRPEGLTGKGLYRFKDAEMESNLYDFKFSEFFADTADFRLKSLEESVLSFSTTNVKAHVDFKERKGTFHSNAGGAIIEFPVNQYICYMEKFTWYMDREEIELGADEVAEEGASDVKLEGSKFISTHPDQDSLNFYSPKAKYDLKKNIITAQDVKYILVADAQIYPDSGLVIIRRNAKMDPLKNAEIVANSITQYHKIYNADVKISGRLKYNASGTYQYKDENGRVQEIVFEDIKVDTTYQTVAEGTIDKKREFTLSPYYDFYGKAILQANNRHLVFDGNCRIAHPCEMLPRNWFAFTAEIDPEDIYIPIDTNLHDNTGYPLTAGMQMSIDSAQMYSTFISKKIRKTDPPIINAYGFLYYDKKEKTYKISNLQKLSEISLPGNYVSLNTANCSMFNEGKIEFGVDLGQVKVIAAGDAYHYLQNDSTYFDLTILIDFFFIEKALTDIAKYITETENDLEPLNFDRTTYQRGLQEFVGKEKADKLISNLTLYGEFKKFPEELNKSLFLADVKMRWDKNLQSFVSEGKIGIGNIYKKQVNKYVDGKIEIHKKRSGDIFNMYLEIDQNTWYYFNYQRGIMQAVSSVEDFNNAIKETKTDKRKLKVPRGQTPYQFMLSTSRKMKTFLRKFEDTE